MKGWIVASGIKNIDRKEWDRMTKRYCFGNPIETEAILHKPECSPKEQFPIKREERSFFFPLAEEDIVYGLGENVRGINKRGWIYESMCADDGVHGEDKVSLYGAHNFFLISGERHLGVFWDTPGRVTFDVGYSKYNLLEVRLEELDVDCYLIEGDSPDAVVEEFRGLIGRSYIPPLWAFGYGQSRWSYMTSEEVREVAKKHRENHLPLDSIYLDIDYMERYKDFTVDGEKFGDFEELVREMEEEHIHLVPIIDAGVKIEEGYGVYEEGKEKGYFCKDEQGEDFVVGVWPGKCHFPDMLHEEAGAWFGNQYQKLLDLGIDGFWNDMNEPAIFYSEKHMEEVFDRIEEFRTKNLDVNSYFEFTGMVAGIANNKKDYQSFYHNYRGERIRHDRVHNLFGYYMTRRASEAFDRLRPDQRVLLFSRSSYVGMHRYGGIWQGDNLGWWSHLALNIKMMANLNMCGFLYTGADIGGFGSNTTEDLMIRWLSFAIFTPLMRNHSAMGTRRQEAYRFEQREVMGDIIKIRYRLLPYLYSEYMKAALGNRMMFRPLGFVYGKDALARRVEDQLMVGESIMIAPVYEQNAVGRTVYIPERMRLLRFHQGEPSLGQEYEKGYHYVEMPLGDVCIFLRENYILPLSRGGEHVAAVDWEDLDLYSFGEQAKPYGYYLDDGISKDFDLEKNMRWLSLA